jgi:molybdate transport system regulatory protein
MPTLETEGHSEPDTIRLRVRLALDKYTAFGPGKADLLEGISQSGSIAAAGRKLGMSYKRAWTLVETLNGSFEEPLVISSRGGQSGGGAHLTATGERILALYRSIETKTKDAAAEELELLENLKAATADR